jgi:protein O-mannosyl-transferase
MTERLAVRHGGGKVEPLAQLHRLRFARTALVLLLALCVLTYLPALRGAFVSDDTTLRSHIRETMALSGWTGLLHQDLLMTESGWRSGFYRPLGTLSMALDGLLYGDSAVGYHVTNLGLHVLATWLVLGLALMLDLTAPAALAVGVLFAVHPVHVEAVAWISGRFDLLCGVFYFASLWLFGLSHARRSVPLYAGALAAGAAALLSKEMALSLPAAVLVLDLLGLSRRRGPQPLVTRGLWREGWRGVAWRGVPFVGLVALYVVARATSRGLELVDPAARLPLLELVCTGGRAVLYYLGLLLFPLHLNAFTELAPVTVPWSPWFLGGLLTLAGLTVLALRVRRRYPAVAYGLLFLLVSLVPLSNAIGFYPLARIRFPVAERYLYVPSFGFLVALGAGLWEATRRFGPAQARWFAVAVVVLGGAATVRTVTRIPVWHDEHVLLEESVRANPKSSWSHLMLGRVEVKEGRIEHGRAELEIALRLAPNAYAALLDMGRTYAIEKRPAEAIPWFERAIAAEPKARDPRLELAVALRQTGRLPEAAEQFAAMGAMGAHDSEFLVDRGELSMATGQLDAAGRDFEAALAINPRRKEAHHNLGVIALRRGDLRTAEEHGEAAVDIDPRYAEAHMLLGNVAVRREDFSAAVMEFATAVDLDSTDVRARVNLGASYLNLGDYPRAIGVLQAALHDAPTVEGWVNLAEAQKRNGDSQAAEHSYREALALDSEQVAARRGLGLLLADAPRRASEARQLLEPVLASNRDDTEVRSALERLRARGAR